MSRFYGNKPLAEIETLPELEAHLDKGEYTAQDIIDLWLEYKNVQEGAILS
tara:strand:+ start:1358 stop:1510 length:153 start_codon:yes stop_codon:yes gene_type:complete